MRRPVDWNTELVYLSASGTTESYAVLRSASWRSLSPTKVLGRSALSWDMRAVYEVKADRKVRDEKLRVYMAVTSRLSH